MNYIVSAETEYTLIQEGIRAIDAFAGIALKVN